MLSFTYRGSAKTPTTVVGKLFSSLFFFFFLAIGSVFFWMLLREEVATLRTWTWNKAPCEILSSRLDDQSQHGHSPSSFSFAVTYRYQVGGLTFISDHYQRKPATLSDYRKAARLVERYPSESAAVCYVNPSKPEEAVLARDDLWLLLFLPLPLVFVAVGGGAIYFTWRSKPAPSASAQSISERASPAKGRRLALVFFSVFLLIGSVVFCGSFLWPVCRILLARSWPAVPCVVLSSEVETHTDSDGDTYRVNIFYRYELNGREFKSNRYKFMGGASSGSGGKYAIVRQYPPGRQTVCFVNPKDPTEAVLERGFTADLWFGLIPLVFMAVGGGGLIFMRRASRSGGTGAGALQSLSSRATAPNVAAALSAARTTDSLVLKPKTAPWVKLLGIIFIALFWNGIVSVFLVQVVNGWRSGRGEWFLTLFLVPFVAVGLGLIVGVVYQLLALFNPRPRLRIAPGAVPLGGELRVEWELTGRTGVVRQLELRLQGREEAQYQRGTTTATDTNCFADIELVSLTNPYEMRSGTRTVTIPANLMHSFAGKHNRIIWSLRLHGDIPRWPDLNEEFPVAVLPAVRKAKEVV